MDIDWGDDSATGAAVDISMEASGSSGDDHGPLDLSVSAQRTRLVNDLMEVLSLAHHVAFCVFALLAANV